MENYAELNSSDEEVLEDVQDALSCIDRLLGKKILLYNLNKLKY